MKYRILIALFLLSNAASFAYGHSHSRVKIVKREVTVEYRHDVKVSDALPIPRDRVNFVGRQRDVLAAAIPASALRDVK